MAQPAAEMLMGYVYLYISRRVDPAGYMYTASWYAYWWRCQWRSG